MNTFEWTNDLNEILPGVGKERVLSNLVNKLKDDNVYTFIFDGNSQVLDHIFVTNNLYDCAEYDIVHVNVDFPRVNDSVGSDHEPSVARLDLKAKCFRNHRKCNRKHGWCNRKHDHDDETNNLKYTF